MPVKVYISIPGAYPSRHYRLTLDLGDKVMIRRTNPRGHNVHVDTTYHIGRVNAITPDGWLKIYLETPENSFILRFKPTHSSEGQEHRPFIQVIAGQVFLWNYGISTIEEQERAEQDREKYKTRAMAISQIDMLMSDLKASFHRVSHPDHKLVLYEQLDKIRELIRLYDCN